MKRFSIIAVIALALVPVVALAQLTEVEGIVGSIGRIVNLLLPIVFAIGLLVFFWGLAKYILAAGDPAKASEGKSIMIWGVIALFVMAAIWGLVRFIGESLGISTTDTDVTAPGVSNLP